MEWEQDPRQVLALVWMPGTDAEQRAAALFATLRQARETQTEADPKALKALADATRLVLTKLASLGARQLGLSDDTGILASEISTVLHQLLGGCLARVPLTRRAIRHAIHTDRIIVGRETLELRDPGATRYAGMLSIDGATYWVFGSRGSGVRTRRTLPSGRRGAASPKPFR